MFWQLTLDNKFSVVIFAVKLFCTVACPLYLLALTYLCSHEDTRPLESGRSSNNFSSTHDQNQQRSEDRRSGQSDCVLYQPSGDSFHISGESDHPRPINSHPQLSGNLVLEFYLKPVVNSEDVS